MYELVIVGAGPIGIFASFYAGMRDINSVTLESSDHYGGQLTDIYPEKPIYDIPGIKEIKAKDLVEQLYNQYLPYKDKVEIKYNQDIKSCELKDDYFVLNVNNEVIETKTILLTSGNGNFNPRRLEVDGVKECKNIFYKLESLQKYKGQNIVVLGGGDSALDWANMLTNVANTVTIIHRRNEFRAHESSLELFKKKNNTKILTPMDVNHVRKEDDQTVIHLTNKDSKEWALFYELLYLQLTEYRKVDYKERIITAASYKANTIEMKTMEKLLDVYSHYETKGYNNMISSVKVAEGLLGNIKDSFIASGI